MDTFKVMFTLALTVLLMVHRSSSDIPKPSYARTMLKVSRSLPGETEELKVRTSEGSLATLIVKRRDRTLPEASTVHEHPTDPPKPSNPEGANETSRISPAFETKTKEEVRKSEEVQIEQLRVKLSDSEKEAIPSKPEHVSVEGKIDSTAKEQPPVEENIDYGNWTPLDTEGRAVPVQDSSAQEYQSWKPLRTDSRANADERTFYTGFESTFPSGGILLSRHLQDRSEKKLQLADRSEEKTRFTFLPHQVRSTRTNVGANLSKNRDAKNVPPEVIVRSEINVKPSAKRSPMTLDRDGTPVIHGKRVPDEPIDKVQTWRNARVINNKLIHEGSAGENAEAASTFYPAENFDRQRFERFFKNVNRRYGKDYEEEGKNVFFEWDPKNYKNEALKAEIYESRGDEPRNGAQKRMLHPDGVPVYPVSELYTPESQKIAPVALKPGARAPVLQYAHPELGVQPAKIVKNEKKRPDNFPENQYSFTEQRQKKKYVLNDKNIVDTYTTKNYYPNQHFYGLKRPSDTPFWVKISENLKSQFSNGVERVSQFTRPVIDPLVEATHKISQNLGLSRGAEAQDKIGTVASGGSILIPALGLVASGAALGIGAVAVGRYLDVDVLRRSNAALGSDVEYQRALDESQAFAAEAEGQRGNDPPKRIEDYGEAVYFLGNGPRNGDAMYTDSTGSLGNSRDAVVLVEEKQEEGREGKKDDATGSRRRKRGTDYLDVFRAEGNLKSLIRNKRLQRKGADSISEIVEIDLPARKGSIDVTEFLIPGRKGSDKGRSNDGGSDILIVEDGPMGSGSSEKSLPIDVARENYLENRGGPGESSSGDEMRNSLDGGDERRRRRSVDSDEELDDALQNLENAEIAEAAHINGDWTNTPCAKRIFCDAMIQRGADAVTVMEKKMAALLSLIQPGAAVQVSGHFQQVMDAVRRHDCSSFLCPQARPGNVFF